MCVKNEASLTHIFSKEEKKKREKKKKESLLTGGTMCFVKVFGVLFDALKN
jgi:hypothetical protein